MRLFVALWPSPEVADVLDGLVRRDHPAVRWTAREQWHVTLRFLGDVADEEAPAVVEALAAAGRLPARPARLGPATTRMGRHALVVPVAGVDDLGAAVEEATAAFPTAAEDRPFTGHLTLARGRGGRPIPPLVVGQAVEAVWPVGELCLVRSNLSPHGARYETIATTPLAPGPLS